MTPTKLFRLLIEERANMTEELSFKVKKKSNSVYIAIDRTTKRSMPVKNLCTFTTFSDQLASSVRIPFKSY